MKKNYILGAPKPFMYAQSQALLETAFSYLLHKWGFQNYWSWSGTPLGQQG